MTARKVGDNGKKSRGRSMLKSKRPKTAKDAATRKATAAPSATAAAKAAAGGAKAPGTDTTATFTGMHPSLRSFFNGLFDSVLAEFTKTGGFSSESKGSARELFWSRTLAKYLPPLVRVTSGDVIDGGSRKTGQLDAVIVHQSFPVLADDTVGVILAEGVIAVLELKSDLSRQWSEVRDTWSKCLAIRRCPPLATFHSASGLGDWALPFVVIGKSGWASPATLARRAEELRAMFPEPACPPVYLVSLEKPMVAAVDTYGAATALGFDHERRGECLARMWAELSDQARRVAYRPIPWIEYLFRGRG